MLGREHPSSAPPDLGGLEAVLGASACPTSDIPRGVSTHSWKIRCDLLPASVLPAACFEVLSGGRSVTGPFVLLAASDEMSSRSRQGP